MNSQQLGRIGENYVAYRLSMLEISVVRMDGFFDFDFMTSNGKTLEIKTSLPHMRFKMYKGKRNEWKSWGFGNSKTETKELGFNTYKRINHERDRNCNFFILVCLNDDFSVLKSFIIPKDIIGKRKQIAIGEGNTARHQYRNYEEKWDLITG